MAFWSLSITALFSVIASSFCYHHGFKMKRSHNIATFLQQIGDFFNLIYAVGRE